MVHLEHGDAVTLVPQQSALTLQEASEILGCSQPYLMKLVKQGKLPSHLADSQRREALGRMARREVEEGAYDTFLLPNA